MKKLGIIPDMLVQSRLEKFIQTYPNLKSCTGESSTNGDEAPVSLTNSNGGGGQKTKVSGFWRRMWRENTEDYRI